MKSGHVIITFDNLQRKFEIFLILKNLTNFFLQKKVHREKMAIFGYFLQRVARYCQFGIEFGFYNQF